MKRQIALFTSLTLLTLFVSTSAISQNTTSYNQTSINSPIENASIGMSITEFKKKFLNRELIKMDKSFASYKVYTKACVNNISKSFYRNFYFIDNKLYKIETKNVSINGSLNDAYLGMFFSDFSGKFPQKELVSINKGISTYKIFKHECFNNNTNNSSYRLVYFQNNKLFKIDKLINNTNTVANQNIQYNYNHN